MLSLKVQWRDYCEEVKRSSRKKEDRIFKYDKNRHVHTQARV